LYLGKLTAKEQQVSNIIRNFAPNKSNSMMCTYKDIDTIVLPNGKTVGEANSDASCEIEHIYLDSWRRGVSVPFFDNAGNTYLANPDGSEDRVKLDRRTRTYRVLRRTAAPGKGRYSYLINR
jgi:hypothetical protein